MLKHIIALLVVSVVVVLFMPYAQQAIQLLITSHDWIAQALADIFAGSKAGLIAKELIALLSVPLLAGLVPAIIYWLFRRHWLPCFMEIVWVIWLLQVGALVIV